MSTEKLESLLKRQEQLKAKIQKEKNKEKEKSRKEDTRKKIIIGAAIIKETETNDALKKWLDNYINNRITKASERELFGLPPLKNTRGEDNQG